MDILKIIAKTKKVILMIFLAICTNSAKAADTEELWQRLLISYSNIITLWGYDMTESSLNPSDYWVNNNWKKGEYFTYYKGVFKEFPYVTKIDDSHIALHNLMKNYRGLFNTSDDLTLIGEIDFDNMTVTFQPQEYSDGYIFASADRNGPNCYTLDELKPVVVSINLDSSWSFIETASAEGSRKNAYALYTLNDDVENTYSAKIGMCGFSLRGSAKVISYIYNPTYVSVRPSDNPITEIQSIVLSTPTEVYENPNITAPVVVKKGDETIDVSVTTYEDRENPYRYVIEFETPLTEVGTYTITIPKGLIGNRTYSDNGFTNGNANPELTYSFTIVDIEKLEYDFDLVASDPTNGETLDRLSQFKLTFASPVSINEAYVSDIKGIGNGTVAIDEADANSVIVSLGAEYVNAGEDTFSFPQGVFGDAKYGEDFTVGHANPAFEVKYIISGKYQMFFDLEPTEIDPKSYETYDEVTEAKITFDVPIVVNEEIAATAFMYKDSYQQSNPISSIVVSPDDDKTVIVTFTNPLVEPGNYDITIRQGTIGDATYGIDYTYGHANKEFRFRYKLSGKGLLKYDFEYVTAEPDDNQPVDRLETITLTFDAPVAINESLAADLKCGDVAVKTIAVDDADSKSVIVTLDSEIIEKGDYTISFPQGLFGDTTYGEAFKAGHANPAFELKYTVTGKYQMSYDLEYVSVDPNPSETCDELTEVKITFDVPIVVNEEVAKTSFMYKDGEQVTNPISSIAVSPDDDKTVVVTFSNALVEAGVYDITLERGAIGDAAYGIDYTYGHANNRFTFCYTISGKLGIDGVMMDGEYGDVEFFNLQGVKVNKENLAPGIYIRKSGNKVEKICIR